MFPSDVAAVAALHRKTFPRQSLSEQWIRCNLAAHPKTKLFVAEVTGSIRGFILWSEKSGFRESVVLELEQISVDPSHQGQGIGSRLIAESLPIVRTELTGRDAELKAVLVTTRADNEAQSLYRTQLGAEAEATIKDLYSADEVIMVARNVPSAK